MKKVLLTGVALGAFALTAGVAFSLPGDGIRGTKHDLSSTGVTTYGADAQDRICVYCHTPHNSVDPNDLTISGNGFTYLPLWNHELSAVAVYDMYSNGSDEPNDPNHASYAEANATDPGGVSKLCLSCHDGTIAINSYGGNAGHSDLTGMKIGAQYTIGGVGSGGTNTLANHHPIGFDYNAAQGTDNEIAVATTAMNANVTIADLLWNGQMECTSCHDVHNTKNDGEKFLWASNDSSNFCMTCHLK